MNINQQLIEAIADDNNQLAKRLLNQGANPNYQDKDGNTPLLLAVLNSDFELVKDLLNRGANPNIQDKLGNTPLLEASIDNNYEIVKELLNQGADPNLQFANGDTPLILASKIGNLEVVKELLNRDANPNLQNNRLDTALILAAKNGNSEIVKELLNRGANRRLSPLALQRGRSSLLRQSQHSTRAESGLLRQSQHSQRAEIDPNLQNWFGSTALMEAAESGNYEIVKELLNHGANPNLEYVNGDTAAILAAKRGNLEIVKELLNHGANPYIQNVHGDDVFSFVKEKNENSQLQREILQLLSEYRLDPALTNPETGVTNLMIIASDSNKFSLFQKLINKPDEIRPIINQQDREGNTALIYAVANNPNPEVIKFLLENGADPLIENNQGYSAVDYARDLGEINILNLFQDYL